MKSGLKTLYGSKLGKLIPVFIIAGLVASASAAVFVNYYGSATATVQAKQVTLIKGSDVSASCSTYPCATATIASTKDFATLGISMLTSATNSPQPNTYYTDLLELNTSAIHTITAITISNIVDSNSALGSISVYFCTAQTNSPDTSANCASFTFTSTTGGSLTGNSILPHTTTATETDYIEVIAHASATAAVSNSVSFAIQISWA
jgi:hypothetical protein